MNDFTRSFLKQLDDAVDDVRDVLQNNRDQLKAQQQALEEATSQYWSASNKVTILTETLRDYERLQAENQHHKKLEGELRERLKRLRDHAKALGDEFRQ